MAVPVVKSPRRGSKTGKPFTSVSSASRASLRSRSTMVSSFGTTNLSAVARETQRKIKWDAVLRGPSPNGINWKWLENVRNFSVYTKQGVDASSGYGVLSIGTIRASVPEVASLLISTSQDEYEMKMAALHDKEFKSGTYMGDVPVDETTGDEQDTEVATHLSVRSATFSRVRWLQRDDQWCYLDSTRYDKEHRRFEKLLTSLTTEDVTQLDRKPKFNDAKRFRDVIAGYCVQPEETDETSSTFAGHAVRVHFYAELDSPTTSARGLGRLVRASTKHEASSKAMKQRMLQLAKDCDRLSHLVRRRRLGIQVLVDQRRVLPPTNVKCFNCDKTQLIAKLCRVCGQGVCGDCSDKYERETHTLSGRGNGSKRASDRRRIRLETIRVCDPCLLRVDSADYSYMSDKALTGAAVFPDRASSSAKTNLTPSAAGDLKQLLHDALLEAPSTQRKGAVMSVIRCVLDQEKALTPPVEPSPMSTSFDARTFEPAMLTPLSADSEYLHALDGLDCTPTLFDQVETADMEGRAYAVNHNEDTSAPMPFPVPIDEDQRVAEIEKLGVVGAGTCDELNIICDIAAKEMNAFATIVTIITAEEQHVVAANVPQLEQMVMKREDAFCAHTIMDNKPLIVPHPEADVRFSRIMPVTGMGIKYYCGFPITSGTDNTVIGTLCCVDQKKHDITESQYNAMQRLAQTAAKVVKLQGERRRSSVTAKTNEVPA